MIYQRLKKRLLWLLQSPEGPPDPPAGSEASLRIFRAAPAFLVLQMVTWGGSFAAAIALELGMVLFSAEGRQAVTAGAIGYVLLAVTVVLLAIKYFLIRLDYDMRYYVVTDRSLRIRQGALQIDESTFTFANVQNLRIHQGPLERLLGLANLVVETAGGAGGDKENKQRSPFGGGHRGVLRGIANATEVRDQMLRLLWQYRDAGLGDPEEHGGLPRGPDLVSAEAAGRLCEIRDELRRARQALGRAG